MRKIGLIVILCAASIGLTAIQARASDWDERTVFTFTEPVQIFGRTLPAGTYTFKIVDTIGADREYRSGSECERDSFVWNVSGETHVPYELDHPTCSDLRRAQGGNSRGGKDMVLSV
jgi:hypothetical protein